MDYSAIPLPKKIKILLIVYIFMLNYFNNDVMITLYFSLYLFLNKKFEILASLVQCYF